MSLSDFIYRPFETLIRPLDIPYAPLPDSGPLALLMHFAAMFRGPLVTTAVLMRAVEGINLSVIWGISFIVDGVGAKGAALFLQESWLTLAVLGVLCFPLQPLLIFVANTLNSQALAVCMPAAMQWQGHKAVERQDLAFFHDLFAGQVAARISRLPAPSSNRLSSRSTRYRFSSCSSSARSPCWGLCRGRWQSPFSSGSRRTLRWPLLPCRTIRTGRASRRGRAA
jgi:hypothetical protein